jgi:hypothetical protein
MTVGDRLGAGARLDLGVGYQLAPDEVAAVQDAIYAQFGSGIILSEAPEEIPQDAAIFAVDMEVHRRGALWRSPGLTLVEDTSPRNLRYTFEQASLDYATELVTFDSPWWGYKAGAGYNFFNTGIAAPGPVGWAAVNVAGVLLASNGLNASYSRQPAAVVLVDQSANIIARTLAVAFGRTFGGYYTEAGIPQSLGLKWNAANGLFSDWAGLGANKELLLSDVGESDKIVALLTVGLDALGIFNRKSLWVGYPTGDYLRPADPRIRVAGLGCVSQETARATPGGVTFLSDEGVAVFDLTNATIISDPINSDLLPLDYNRISGYKAVHLPNLQRYILMTPFCTWIYEFPHPGGRRGRWFRRSLIADSAVAWSTQSGGLHWDDMVGSWDTAVGTWDSLALTQSEAPAILHFILGGKLTRESRASFSNIIANLTPCWQTPQNEKHVATNQYTTLGFELSYRSQAAAQIRLSGTNYENSIQLGLTKNLPVTAGALKKGYIWNATSGMGVRAQIEVISGDPEIVRVRQMVLAEGPVQTSL